MFVILKWKNQVIDSRSNQLLNKKTKIIAKCWHQNKFKLANFEVRKQKNRITWSVHLSIGTYSDIFSFLYFSNGMDKEIFAPHTLFTSFAE